MQTMAVKQFDIHNSFIKITFYTLISNLIYISSSNQTRPAAQPTWREDVRGCDVPDATEDSGRMGRGHSGRLHHH